MPLNTDFSTVLTLPVFQHVKVAAEALGLETYVVGGFVRDHLLGRKKEKPTLTLCVGSGIALAKAVQERLPQAAKISVFKTYGTAMIKFEGMDLEFVGARKESYRAESRNPSVEEGSLEDDQNRRDFTVNALAVSLNKSTLGALIDPFNGLDDLKQRTLRTP